MALTLWEALVLGVVQGVTEWLPVSSSGHLVLTQRLLGVEVPVFYDLVLHIGTLLAVLVAYRERLYAMAAALVAWPRDARGTGWGPSLWLHPDRRLAALLVLGTIPIAVAGLLLEDLVLASFDSLAGVGAALLVTGLWLLSTRWATRRDGMTALTPARAVLVGVAQAAALMPGISRSGATIGASIHAGVRRDAAADFAFLLAVPALLGALILQADSVGEVAGVGYGAALLGFLVSFVAGYASLRWLVGFVRRAGLWPFAPYCMLVGAMTLGYALT